MTKTTTAKPTRPEFAPIPGGGVTSAAGFRAAGIHAGFRKKASRLDLALVVADRPCAAAGIFTKNVFCAAPVDVSRRHLDDVSFGMAQAVMVNSGNANAATGDPGRLTAEKSAELAAASIGCQPNEVLLASTGVIGSLLSLEPFESGIPAVYAALSAEGGHDAASAIMTTDTYEKECAVSYVSEADGFAGTAITVGGMTKGSGMIMPDMATMIAVITTDAPLSPSVAHAALKHAAGLSFNKVTVDSDTSTNDTCFLLASGEACSPDAGGAPACIEKGSAAYGEFLAALEYVCIDLARKIAADGEGATKLITVSVTGAASDEDADRAARAIANSPLVKTAVFGHDANWGRIAMAAGKSGAIFRQERVSISIMGIPVCAAGLTVAFDEEEALRRFEAPEIAIDVDLGAGTCSTTIWTCDYSHDYITINGDYRT